MVVNMDRKIPASVKRKRVKKKIIVFSGITIFILAVFLIMPLFLEDTLSKDAFDTGEVDQGAIETTISASGKLSPLVEEIIVSPIILL